MCRPPLRFVTYLAPNMRCVYEFNTRYVGERLGIPTELNVGRSYKQIPRADIAFLCGLPYIIAYTLQSLPEGGERIVILRVIHTARHWPKGGWPK